MKVLGSRGRLCEQGYSRITARHELSANLGAQPRLRPALQSRILSFSNAKAIVTTATTTNYHAAMEAALVGERDGYKWYHVDDPAGPALDQLAKTYGLHELAIEDCRVPGTRAKIDPYGDTLFVVGNIVHYDSEINACSFTEMDFFVNEKFVISVTQGQNGFADAVKSVFTSDPRLSSPARLLHRLLDGMVDRYLPILDSIEERIENVEEKAIEHTSPKLLAEIFELKRALIEFRRVGIAMRDMVSQLLRRSEPWLESEKLYFQDIYEHLLRALEFTETYRDILTGVLEVHLTAAANRTNDIVKVMTLAATVTLPILLITGYYGMNFDNLPFQHSKFGIYFATGLMTLLVAILLVIFKRTGWY
jgi:magnesium transporter